MKKLLSSVAILALMTSGVNAAPGTGTIDLTATILDSATVKLGSNFGANELNNGDGEFLNYINPGVNIAVGADIAKIILDQDLYLQTNTNAKNVKIQLNTQELVMSSGGTTTTVDNMTLSYFYDKTAGATASTAITAATDFSMTDLTTTNDGTTAVGRLTIKADVSEYQPAGTYTAQITATVSPT